MDWYDGANINVDDEQCVNEIWADFKSMDVVKSSYEESIKCD